MVVRMGEDGDENHVKKKRKKFWGTWEELILGAAVLRLGTKDWNDIASLLQSRAPYTALFTSEDCKAKYEELQQRYPGCNAWLDELKKRRVAELKKALMESETSIGSLESKIELLKAEKTCNNAADCSSSRAESESSPLQFRKSDTISEFSGKDVPKDGLSAGSYTEETGPKWSSSYSMYDDVSEDKTGIQPLVLETKPSGDGEYFGHTERFLRPEQRTAVVARKKRTQKKRKRRIWNAKQMGAVENHSVNLGNVGCSDDISQEMDIAKVGGSCSATGATCTVKESGVMEDLAEVLKSIFENDQAAIFQRKMDSQKRARYRKVIRQHMDLELINSRITSKSISTVGELLRDLLLLANNALVFYSKTTREYKCALVLRELVNKKLRGCFKWPFFRPLLFKHSHACDAEPPAKHETRPTAKGDDKPPAKRDDLPEAKHGGKPPPVKHDDMPEPNQGSKPPSTNHDGKPPAKHNDKLPVKPRNDHHLNKTRSIKAPSSSAAALAPSTTIATKYIESTTNKGDMDRKGRKSTPLMESLVKVKRQKGRPAQAKNDPASALVDTSTWSSPIKPRKRPRAALMN